MHARPDRVCVCVCLCDLAVVEAKRGVGANSEELK